MEREVGIRALGRGLSAVVDSERMVLCEEEVLTLSYKESDPQESKCHPRVFCWNPLMEKTLAPSKHEIEIYTPAFLLVIWGKKEDRLLKSFFKLYGLRCLWKDW